MYKADWAKALVIKFHFNSGFKGLPKKNVPESARERPQSAIRFSFKEHTDLREKGSFSRYIISDAYRTNESSG
jgi:hypothetical protein